LLSRLERAGDISRSDRRLIGAEWRSRCDAEASDRDAEYWSLRIIRDLGRALGAPAAPQIDIELSHREGDFTRALREELDRGLS